MRLFAILLVLCVARDATAGSRVWGAIKQACAVCGFRRAFDYPRAQPSETVTVRYKHYGTSARGDVKIYEDKTFESAMSMVGEFFKTRVNAGTPPALPTTLNRDHLN